MFKIRNFSFKRTAKKDIVVYKYLVKDVNYEHLPFKSESSFNGIIRGIKCKGKIFVGDNIYFCTNNHKYYRVQHL